jgi:hypothetical protein
MDSVIAAHIIPSRFGDQNDLDRPTPTDAHAASIWPSTFATEWCGEFSDG